VQTTSTNGGRGADTAYVLAGALLPVRVARAVAEAYAKQTQALGGGEDTLGPCRRYSARRVDCTLRGGGLCQYRAAFALRPDGTVIERRYAVEPFDETCAPSRNAPLGPAQAVDWRWVLRFIPGLLGR
jgi:hypothetical protein